jgi:hypothetical protein
MPTLNITSTTLVYGDTTVNSNPKYRFLDWTRKQEGESCTNPKNEQFTVDPSASLSIFNGTRTTSIDGTTAFSVTQSPLDASIYRFTATGGTLPAFRTDRNLALSGVAVTMTMNANATVSMTVTVGTPFATTIAGDTILITGLNTGDSAGVFSTLNQGYWTVIGVITNKNITLARPAGVLFTAASEVVTPSSNTNVLNFTGTGVQLNDKVEISAGFAVATQKSFTIATVTPNWFEVVSTTPLALENAIIPGAAGMAFYKFSKRYVRVETDQEAAIQANGDSGQTQRISPRIIADPDNMAFYDKYGPMWSLVVVNRSTTTMICNVISVE